MRPFLLAVCAVSLLGAGGCQTATVPNPNDPTDVGALSPEIIRRNLRSITESLAERRAHGEFTTKRYRELVAKAASELLASVDVGSIEPSQAWEYGELLRDAQKWKEAEPVLKVAIEWAKETKNADRRVNDTLRLAVVQAHLGRIPEAIQTASLTLDATPKQSAPILMSTLLELTPVARGKGNDIELAHLLEKAIVKHTHTEVDPNTVPGRDFLAARPYHIRNAWTTIARLYHDAGKDDLAEEALRKSMAQTGAYSPNIVR